MGNEDFCIPNIGPRQRRRRRIIAGVAFIAGAIAAGLLVAQNAAAERRFLVFLPFWIGALSWLEARAKTCVVLSSRGIRNLDSGNERVADDDELRQIRRQARRVYVQAFLAAALLTMVIFAL
jgi:hypothetical protein